MVAVTLAVTHGVPRCVSSGPKTCKTCGSTRASPLILHCHRRGRYFDPEDGSNFVPGDASLFDRIGLFSFARYSCTPSLLPFLTILLPSDASATAAGNLGTHRQPSAYVLLWGSGDTHAPCHQARQFPQNTHTHACARVCRCVCMCCWIRHCALRRELTRVLCNCAVLAVQVRPARRGVHVGNADQTRFHAARGLRPGPSSADAHFG